MGYVRLKKVLQGKDTLNNKKSPSCWHWCHGPLSFLHIFLRFFLLLILQHSGKLTIPHDNVFLFLHILHLALFKFLHHKVELIISGDIHVVFGWARDRNRAYCFWGHLIYHFFRNGFFAIYFWPSVAKICPLRAAPVQKAVDLVYRYMVHNVNVLLYEEWARFGCLVGYSMYTMYVEV